MLRAIPFYAVLLCACALYGAEQPTKSVAQLDATLPWKTGKIKLPGGKAELDVPPQFRYLEPAAATTVLVKIWGNPPGTQTLGMLFPADKGPFHEDGWGIVISYQDDGHVSDEDAESINYDELLTQMKASSDEDNKARKEKGYEPVEIVGWATTPRYDKSSKKMFWAEELRFGGNPTTTLNYKIRVLGRTGVLVLNCVADSSQLAIIEQQTPAILSFTEFTQGNKYADYQPGSDKLATYGVGALVAGSVAAKTGLLKGIFLALLAAKKLVVVGLIAVAAFVYRMFGGGKKEA